MKITIDRFEGNYAVCQKEDRKMINIDISKIPSNSKDGDILYIENNKISIDSKLNKDRKKYIKEITKDLWEN